MMKLIHAGSEIVSVAVGIVASNSVKGLSVNQRVADGKDRGIIMLLYLCAFVVPVDSQQRTSRVVERHRGKYASPRSILLIIDC